MSATAEAADGDPAAIAFERVTRRYPGGQTALAEASFTIPRGSFRYLTGHSGAGKSTVFRLIAALERPSSGGVRVNGEDIGRLSLSGIPFLRRKLGLILQDQRLLFDRSVFDNVLLPLAVCGVAPDEAARRVRAALDRVGLRERERAFPVQLSGGEQQRVCIARAVVNRPALLLADEPTASLDEAAANAILELFRAFHGVGVTIVVATHDQALMARYPAERIVLDHGRVVA